MSESKNLDELPDLFQGTLPTLPNLTEESPLGKEEFQSARRSLTMFLEKFVRLPAQAPNLQPPSFPTINPPAHSTSPSFSLSVPERLERDQLFNLTPPLKRLEFPRFNVPPARSQDAPLFSLPPLPELPSRSAPILSGGVSVPRGTPSPSFPAPTTSPVFSPPRLSSPIPVRVNRVALDSPIPRPPSAPTFQTITLPSLPSVPSISAGPPLKVPVPEHVAALPSRDTSPNFHSPQEKLVTSPLFSFPIPSLPALGRETPGTIDDGHLDLLLKEIRVLSRSIEKMSQVEKKSDKDRPSLDQGTAWSKDFSIFFGEK